MTIVAVCITSPVADGAQWDVGASLGTRDVIDRLRAKSHYESLGAAITAAMYEIREFPPSLNSVQRR